MPSRGCTRTTSSARCRSTRCPGSRAPWPWRRHPGVRWWRSPAPGRSRRCTISASSGSGGSGSCSPSRPVRTPWCRGRSGRGASSRWGLRQRTIPRHSSGYRECRLCSGARGTRPACPARRGTATGTRCTWYRNRVACHRAWPGASFLVTHSFGHVYSNIYG